MKVSPSVNSGDNELYLKLNDAIGNGNRSGSSNRQNNKWCCCHIKIPITGRLKPNSLTVLLIIFIIDILANVYLFCLTHNWWFFNDVSVNSNGLFTDFRSFHRGTFDTILLCALRFLLLIIFTVTAIYKGVPNELWVNNNNKQPKNAINDKLEILISNDYTNDIELDSKAQYQSKEDTTKLDESLSSLSSEKDESIEGIQDNRKFQPQFNDKEAIKEYNKRRKKSTVYKYCILLFMFLLCSIFQSYMGVKCIAFAFSDTYIIPQSICYGLCILCINIEIFVLKDIVENATDHGDNVIVKSLHPHALNYKSEKQHHCDVCRKPNDKTYRCMRCDYDICCDCFKKEKKRLIKKSKQTDTNDACDDTSKQLNSTKYFLRSIQLCKPHRYIVLSGIIFLVISSGLSLLLPSFQGKIFDDIINGDKSGFMRIIKYYLILSIFSGLFNSLRDMMFHFLWQRLTAGIRKQMFANITIQDITFFDDTSTGELLSRLGNDVWQMTDPIHNVLRSSLSNMLLLIGGMVMCFVTSWRLSMLAFTTLAPILYLTQQYSKWSRNIWSSVWGSFAKSNSVAQQAFANIRTVRAFGTELKEIQKYNKSIDAMLKSGLIVNIGGIVISFATNYLDLGAGVLLLYFGGMSLFNMETGDFSTELTIGKLITFQLYWNKMTAAYKGLQNVLTSFTKGLSAGERVLLILDRMSKHKNHLYNGKKCELDGTICIDNVSFTYESRPEEPVLKGINLHIEPSEVVAVVGKSGGGKTTLIHLLMRFYDIKEGGIYYNKNKISLNDLNLTQFRQQIGFVGQETETFDASVKDNIIYGVVDDDGKGKEISMEEIIHYSKLANCHEFVSKFEEEYETKVGERGIKLSGGQKQRLAIARMLIKKPKILLLDEATSNLDTESEALVQAAIDKTIWYKNDEDEMNINEEQKYDDEKFKFRANAVILIAHRLSTVINADKIAVIDDGKIVELGNHQQLLEIENGVYKKLVQRQIQKEKNQLNLEKKDGNKNNKQDNDTIDSLFD